MLTLFRCNLHCKRPVRPYASKEPDGVHTIGKTWWIRLNRLCVAAMRPYVKVLWRLVVVACTVPLSHSRRTSTDRRHTSLDQQVVGLCRIESDSANCFVEDLQDVSSCRQEGAVRVKCQYDVRVLRIKACLHAVCSGYVHCVRAKVRLVPVTSMLWARSHHRIPRIL